LQNDSVCPDRPGSQPSWVASSVRALIDLGHTVERALLEQLPDEYVELRARLAAELK